MAKQKSREVWQTQLMINSEILAVIYGLVSAASWGTADFSGGVATKRNNVYRVMLGSQMVGGVFLAWLAVMWREPWPSPGSLGWGGLAGIFGAVGLAALYKGLAGGQMGLVAPVTAVLAAILPVMVGIFNEGLPSWGQAAGFGLGLGAVWLLAGADYRTGFRWQTLTLPLIAGAGFGLFFILIDRVSQEAILWPLVAARVTSVGMLAVFVWTRRSGQPVSSRYPWLMITLAGVFDSGGNAFFALATQAGRLDIAAVLSSLYPAATVFWAWLILKERLTPQQWAGVAAALAALVCIAA